MKKSIVGSAWHGQGRSNFFPQHFRFSVGVVALFQTLPARAFTLALTVCCLSFVKVGVVDWMQRIEASPAPSVIMCPKERSIAKVLNFCVRWFSRSHLDDIFSVWPWNFLEVKTGWRRSRFLMVFQRNYIDQWNKYLQFHIFEKSSHLHFLWAKFQSLNSKCCISGNFWPALDGAWISE